MALETFYEHITHLYILSGWYKKTLSSLLSFIGIPLIVLLGGPIKNAVLYQFALYEKSVLHYIDEA